MCDVGRRNCDCYPNTLTHGFCQTCLPGFPECTGNTNTPTIRDSPTPRSGSRPEPNARGGTQFPSSCEIQCESLGFFENAGCQLQKMFTGCHGGLLGNIGQTGKEITDSVQNNQFVVIAGIAAAAIVIVALIRR